ncbi:arylsulfatase [Pseudoalteromonas shioyasakiensis]|uniref:arylsulfatase n=1 Tax=Pseudoalteromonas TaxID=53246 RepID=UPI00143084C5|nr:MULTISPECIES: arylsulfatase [Pseudoalteromonas]MCQ8881712.1 arylsulfatase [Pseudoalteromonas shioyasakiensis]NIZ06483.1 arylsulfatase [Pseudoalteromonas sp. HF66]QLE09150.1 arylsulfatase [Pseudoalteromonas shioyasakiensis]QWV05712.1 arylsulfatase [Pseudoalteromonas shioyasakiensis]
MDIIKKSVVLTSALTPYIASADTPDRTQLPIPDVRPQTYSQLDVRDVQRPDPTSRVKAPDGAPNVLVILLDDVGFSQSSLFGGAVDMPTLSALAKQGLMYNQFHTTGVSSATRTAILTGRNHHQNNMGSIAETATAFPGNTGVRPNYIAALPKILKYNGYSTAMFGKNHEIPAWETGPAGVQTLWPKEVGFDKFYGFFGGETDQYQPVLIDGITRIKTPRKKDYHFTEDMTDKTIEWLNLEQSYNADKPFFIYYAPGAVHAPHHAPKEWIDKYKGKFSMGWDKLRQETFERQKANNIIPKNTVLPPMPDFVPRWDSLTADEKRVFERQMEVYAGYLAHTDHEIGRVVETLKKNGEFDNTLIFYIVGDNGASAEGNRNGSFNSLAFYNGIDEPSSYALENIEKLGGPESFPHYASGWAVAGDSPFVWTKGMASDYGGTRNAMVVSWPHGIKKNGQNIRSQWSHVVDIAPTVLETAKLPFPKKVEGIKQIPMAGVSFAQSFNNPDAETDHKVQYFELAGNRAIYKDGWLARVTHWALTESSANFTTLQKDEWELFDTTQDWSLSNNLADKYPKKLKEMKKLFDKEAQENHVYPIDDRTLERMNAEIAGRPDAMFGKQSLTLYEGAKGIPENSFLNIKNKSFDLVAKVITDDVKNTNGVVIAQGGNFAGWTLFVKNGVPTFEYNWLTYEYTKVSGSELKKGENEIKVEFRYDEDGKGGKGNAAGLGKGGNVYLYVNGKLAAKKLIPNTIASLFSLDDGVGIGEDEGGAVSLDYEAPFTFNKKIEQVTTSIVQ